MAKRNSRYIITEEPPTIIPARWVKAMSYEELSSVARNEFNEDFSGQGEGDSMGPVAMCPYMVMATYPDSLIIADGAEYYRVPYTVTDGDYIFEPQESWQRVEQDWIDSNLKAVTKKEADGDHPASHYLVVEDSASPSTWHLRVRDSNGDPDHRLMGAAWAALHGGYRGSKYEGPGKQDATSKLKKMYDAEGMDTPAKSLDFDFADELVYFGDAVKAVGDGKVEGYLVRFGSPKDTDAEGEYFTKDTDFDFSFGGDEIPVTTYYHHGMDPDLKRRKLGKGTLRQDNVGVWIEAQLALRDEYEKAVYAMAEQGKLGWSSGSAPHLIERKQVGKAVFIKSWPLGLDASLTPTPAEFRNKAVPVKSLTLAGRMFDSKGAQAIVANASKTKVPTSVEWDRAQLKARALLIMTDED